MLVSNNHVIPDGESFIVIYAQDGTTEAELVGAAPEFKLAVLKIEEAVPATVEWGASDEVPLGAHIIAIGSALGRIKTRSRPES